MPPKTLYPKQEEQTFPIKIHERELKIVICVSLVWCITFLFLSITIWFLHNLISKKEEPKTGVTIKGFDSLIGSSHYQSLTNLDNAVKVL